MTAREIVTSDLPQGVLRNRQNRLIKIAVVGDVHDRWKLEDHLALEYLGVDLVLFVGDFGDESVEIVRLIASMKIPKAVILGNHDAWYSASHWGKQRSPYDQNVEDRVQQQLDLLGETHVGYGKLDFPQFNLSVVGSRPFSWGGSEWKNKEFLRDRYGINNFEESTARIVAAAEQTEYDNLIFIGHNGPTGLGDRPFDSCGKDWGDLGGDHGDPDFAQALEKTRDRGKTISLVTFGHMHHRLRHTKERLRTIVNVDLQQTIYLNAATVPRIVETHGESQRNFTIVLLEDNVVSQISLLWLGQNFQTISEQILYSQKEPILESIVF
jgi:uncharacterized protein (TIGR04168 family)